MLKTIIEAKLSYLWPTVTVSLLVIAFISWILPYSKGYQAANEDYHANEKQYQITAEKEKECLEFSDGKKILDCYKKDEKAYYDHHRANQDLNAQREMADWTEGVLWATLVIGGCSVVLTGFGVFLIWKTAQFTSDTLEATKTMLVESKKTTLAAEKTSETALEDFNTRNPPKVKIVQIFCKIQTSNPLSGSLFLINEGGTNAKLTKKHADAEFWPSYICIEIGKNPPTRFPQSGFSGIIEKKVTLRSGEAFQWTFKGRKIDEREAVSILRGEIKIFVMGIVRFSDETQSIAQHRSIFCRVYCPETKRWIHTNDDDYEYQT